MEWAKAARNSLADLSSRVEIWRKEFRGGGFSASFVDEDWAVAASTTEERWDHKRYLSAYWRAVLLGVDKSEIIYSDALIHGQELLNQLKQTRIVRHGSIDSIFSNPRTRHLAELTPVYQRLSRSRERMTAVDVEHCQQRDAERQRRKRASLLAWAPEVAQYVAQIQTLEGDDEALGFFASRVIVPSAFAPRTLSLKCQGEILHAVMLPINDTYSLALAVGVGQQLVSCGPSDVFVYYVALENRLAFPGAEIDAALFIDIPALVPFESYRGFEDWDGLSLSILAMRQLNELIVPDILACLRSS